MAAQDAVALTGMSRVKKFVREIKMEMRKVTWPNKRELIAYTSVVFISVIFIAILIWVIDAMLTQIFRAIM